MIISFTLEIFKLSKEFTVVGSLGLGPTADFTFTPYENISLNSTGSRVTSYKKFRNAGIHLFSFVLTE